MDDLIKRLDQMYDALAPLSTTDNPHDHGLYYADDSEELILSGASNAETRRYVLLVATWFKHWPEISAALRARAQEG